LDEEELALNLSVAHSPNYAASAAKVFEGLRAGFNKRPGRLPSILRRLRGRVPVRTRSGLVVGSTGALEIDLEKTHRVLIKIAHGLHFHHTGHRPPLGKTPHATFYSQKVWTATTQEIASDKWQAAQFKRFWDPHFRYHGYVDPDGHGAIWWLRFYQFHLGIIEFGLDNCALGSAAGSSHPSS
jgi:hypothetical protein